MFGIPNSLVLGRSLIYKSKLSGIISIFIYAFLSIIISIELVKVRKRYFRRFYGTALGGSDGELGE